MSLRQIFVEIRGAAKLEFIDLKDKLVKSVLSVRDDTYAPNPAQEERR